MKFTGRLKSVRMGMEQYKAKLHERMSDLVAHAAFLWLNEVTSYIPIWSGASHATFLQLSRAVGAQLAVSSVKGPNRVSYGTSHGKGSVTADAGAGKYVFKYATTLPHLIWNEYFNANVTPDPTLFAKLLRPGPYRFQQGGQKVFKEFAKTARLPNPSKTLQVKTIKV